MKRHILLISFFIIVSIALGGVSTHVFLADGSTPFEYQDVMVGTRLTIVVDSNSIEEWAGALLLEGDHRDKGLLLERADSLYAAGGVGGLISHVEEYWDEIGADVNGFDLYTGFMNIETGRWFILDYSATSIGDCNIGFYEHQAQPPFGSNFVHYLEFTHVRTRDFDGSTGVDIDDFAILGSYWHQSCTDPNWCEGTDLDVSGTVDRNDLILFTDYWLERTE